MLAISILPKLHLRTLKETFFFCQIKENDGIYTDFPDPVAETATTSCLESLCTSNCACIRIMFFCGLAVYRL